MTPEMAIDVVVDDSTTARPWSAAPPVWRSRRPVPTIAVLALVVMLVLTGPHLLRPTVLSLAWRLDTTTRFFWLTAQTVYTLDAVGDEAVLAAHDTRSRRVTWTLPLHGPLSAAYAESNPLFSSDVPPSGEDGVRTAVVVASGTLIYPVAAVPLVYLSGDLAVTVDRDTASTPPGAASSNNGLEWTHVVTAFDLNSRAVVWTRRLPAGTRWSLPGVRAGAAGIVGLPDGADWMVTAAADGHVDVLDLRTGAVVATRTVGVLGGRSYVTALADAVLVSRDEPGGASLEAFDPERLTPLWRLTAPLERAEPVSCQPDLCLVTNRTVWIVDPRTGLVTTRINGTSVRPGPPGLALVAPYGENTTVIMTEDGMALPLSEVWRVVDGTAYVPSAVVAQVRVSGRADLGLLDVRTATVLRLGEASQWSAFNTCLAVGPTVACDSGESLSVWHHGPVD